MSVDASPSCSSSAPHRSTAKVKRMATSYELQTLTHLVKRPMIDLEFTDVSYSVTSPSTENLEERKTILQAVSGKFQSGELSAIMGSSGAGKTTLMNILAGYVRAGVSGSVKTNGLPVQTKLFNKLSAYIMQDDLLQPYLSVGELMTIAANLKLGSELGQKEKNDVVLEVLKLLGLEKTFETRTCKLSGGQRKRLSVALELVNNPPVIFLDEPTTGLDTVATSQLISLIKLLARQGRTIICTIHQPTASIYQQFDHVYVLGRGQCVYQGSHDQLVPFLSSAGFDCPITYNPADYVIECIHGESYENVRKLSGKMMNGKLNFTTENPEREEMVKLCRQQTMNLMPSLAGDGGNTKQVDFPTNFFTQVRILTSRNLIQKFRNKVALTISLIHIVSCATLLALVFFGVGQDAGRVFDNFRFAVSCVVLVAYTYCMIPILTFPSNIRIMKREYFNRWYGLRSYYTSFIITSLPDHLIFTPILAVITYFATDQLLEPVRFVWFLAFCIMTGIVAESIGQAIGSYASETNGSVLGPCIVSPFLALAFYGLGFGESIEPFMQFLMSTSFLRHGLVGIVLGLYQDRSHIPCPKESDYCHHVDANILLRDIGIEHFSIYQQIGGLFLVYVIFRTLAFLILRMRLNLDFSNSLIVFAKKLSKRFRFKA